MKDIKIDKKINEILNKIGRTILLKAIRFAPIDTGNLRSNMGYKVEGNKVIIYCNVDYAEDLEYGKPPEPLSEEEKEGLKDWSERHNIPYYAVKKKIETKGIEVGTVENPKKMPNNTYRPFMRPALHQSIPEIKQIIKETL